MLGSSLELAPSLLSIFDSIASANKDADQNDSDQSGHKKTVTCDEISNQSTGQQTPVIKINADNCNHSGDMESHDNDVTNDNKKRPLSISSMSSSSSSSLPRHTCKRPNLSEYEPRHSLPEVMDSKLDSILYIDDDVPNGVTDDEMSVDTDYENNRKCESDASSNITQSSASLSSNNDNLSKSNETNDKQSIKEVTENGLHTPNSCHDNHDDSQCNSVASTPGSSFYQTPNTSSTSISSPLVIGQGQGQTPTSTTTTPTRQTSLRDSTSPQKYVSRVQRVVAEIVDTEKTYVCHLKEIIEVSTHMVT